MSLLLMQISNSSTRAENHFLFLTKKPMSGDINRLKIKYSEKNNSLSDNSQDVYGDKKLTKLDYCLKCQNHVSYKHGFVICNYWKQNQQHVTHQESGGAIYVIGCSMKPARKKVS